MESATVVMYPSPEMGHLVSMMELGKLMQTHHPSIFIVILITPAPSKTGSISTGKYINTISGTTPSITFHHLPTLTFPPELSSHEFVELSFGIPQLYNPIGHATLVKSTRRRKRVEFWW
ncbi:hypothetical protein L6452_12618 [Arctium lappa]|uniref:Uncharacterized protein n=1 Tax=Arctium lappa TaxID=4217 RepID=A0ACB9DQS1_ARCLA|nr:hypothetical protein L6452_12618 [Arctium lappa]